MRFSLVLSVTMVLSLGACGDDDTAPSDAGTSAVDSGRDSGVPARACRSGQGWSPGAPAFVDRTDDWALGGLDVRTFAVVDIDQDGFPDIAAIHPAYARGVGTVYLNRPSGTGRRFVEQSDTNLFAARDGDPAGRLASLITIGDVNNDGAPDAFVDQQDYPPAGAMIIRDGPDIVLNDGTGHFALTADPQIVGPARPLAVGAFFFDQNLDGNLDLAIGYWWVQPPFTMPFGQHPQLFRGDGAGAFTEVTHDVGMNLLYTTASIAAGTNARPLFGITMCDVNDDGRMDIVGSAYGRMFNELFVSDGDMLAEQARERGVASDTREDYSDDESFRCYCLMHATDAYCAGASPPTSRAICTGFGGTVGRGWTPGVSDQPYNLGGNTFTHVCEDFDNDGDFDLYESNIKHPDVGSSSDPSELLVNDGTGHFARPGRETMGLTPPVDLRRIDEGGQQAAAWDFDDDGRMDILLAGSPYPSNRGWLFHQLATGTLQFEYAGDDSGIHHACPSGMALADFDHDGDEDVIVGTYGCNADYPMEAPQPTRFYENVSTDANWVSIRLVGRGGAGHANRSALGARVRVTAGGVTQSRLVAASWGQGGMSREQVAFFGLGDQCDIERVEVRWPDASLTVQTFTGVVANQRIELREGDEVVRYLP